MLHALQRGVPSHIEPKGMGGARLGLDGNSVANVGIFAMQRHRIFHKPARTAVVTEGPYLAGAVRVSLADTAPSEHSGVIIVEPRMSAQ
jgi:hypothetical protein